MRVDGPWFCHHQIFGVNIINESNDAIAVANRHNVQQVSSTPVILPMT
jgi:hypothetical protein